MDTMAVTQANTEKLTMIKALSQHWPEYLIEASGLGLFMISACFFGFFLEHPDSPVHQTLPDPFLRRVLMGIAMGLTAVGIIYSPWGKQSGAHINPSVTLTFFRLGKVKFWDASFYIIAQFVGAVIGVLIASTLMGQLISHPAVNYVATVPGMVGNGIAFIAELIISFILMFVILIVSNTNDIARYTGLFAGVLVAVYISLEAPISGMSMNPARSFGSAFHAQLWNFLWIYFTAPPIGMLLAAEVYLRTWGSNRVSCAKLHHQNDKRCIHCGYPGAVKTAS
ncbi:MAG: major intrinsic protein [Candidatus Dadabacteria bacterium CSP1-2]|nr:MAG: major intrinsic protein [Candidatus Dadabacteria bacterium CSP1-2]